MLRRRLMGPMGLLSAAMSSGGDIIYLLNDSFNDDKAAGAVNGTPATPGPGDRVAVEVDGQLSISSGVLNVPPQATPVWGDLGLRYSQTFERNVGDILLAKYHPSVLVRTATIGWKEDANVDTTAGGGNRHVIFFQDTSNRILVASGLGAAVVKAFWVLNNDYFTAIVLRSSGAYFFIKGGAFTDWTLLWHDSVDNSDPMYAVTSNFDQTYTLDDFRIPRQLWLPTPLAYTEFAAVNGTSLDALDTLITGPDGQGGVVSRIWAEQVGDFDIQSNKCTNQSGADNEGIATVFIGEANVVIDQEATIGQAGGTQNIFILLRYSDTTHFWAIGVVDTTNQFHIYENDGGWVNRASAGAVINDDTSYDIRVIAYGQTIDGYLDGVTRISYGLASFNETETIHGIRHKQNTSIVNKSTTDNFLIFPRTEGAGGGYSTLDKFIG